ncbi:hypothetical protein GJAV_G00087340 [Gymnothorax javanicus]|nr:hypothetical protein GJAV_G00087340 [Gymnothorax javanicus]
MMQAGVRLRQDTETTLPELPEQHSIREKEEELHGLESVHMAESETKCTTPRLNTLKPECVTANSRVSDSHYLEGSFIKTETDLSPSDTEDLKTESPDFTELAKITHPYIDHIKIETDDGNYIKTESVGVLQENVNVSYVEKPCEMCLSQTTNLKSRQRIHKGEKPFKCTKCEMCFTKGYNLKRHQQTHTGERPFRCTKCLSCFSQKGSLNRHQRIHSGEKPYRCMQCGMCFSQKVHLKSHLFIHSGEKPYKCTLCEMCFSEKYNLECHQRTHTGEKPYRCPECPLCFSQRSGLNRHQKIHTGEKPYRCMQCGMCFSQTFYLKCHQKIHASGKTLQMCNM